MLGSTCKWSQGRRTAGQLTAFPRDSPATEMGAGGFVPLPDLLRHLGLGATEAAVRRVVATDSKGRYQLDDSTAPPQIRAVQGHSVEVEAPLLHPVADAAAVPLAVHVTSEEGWVIEQGCRRQGAGRGRQRWGARCLCGSMAGAALAPSGSLRYAQLCAAQLGPLLSSRWTAARSAPPRPHFRRRWRAIQDSGELRRMSRTHIHFATQPNHLRANSWATVLLQVRWGRSA